MASLPVFSMGTTLPRRVASTLSKRALGSGKRTFAASRKVFANKNSTSSSKRKVHDHVLGGVAKRTKYTHTTFASQQEPTTSWFGASSTSFGATSANPSFGGAPAAKTTSTGLFGTAATANKKRVHSTLAQAATTAAWSGNETFMATLLFAGTTASFAAGAHMVISDEDDETNSNKMSEPNAMETEPAACWTPTRQITIPLAPSSSQLFPQTYDASVGALQGRREAMEDDFILRDGGRFAAVFDGHGGAGVSAFLRQHLYACFCQQQLQQPHSELLVTRVDALRQAFRIIEKKVLEVRDFEHQGSTAVAVLLHEEVNGERTLIAANVGDSRAVLSRNGKAIPLTRDHKPGDALERQRIHSMGETVTYDNVGGIYRVRNLAIARSIGDRFAKPVVTGEPEIKLVPLKDEGDEFVILASDGLWDVFSNEEAIRFVHKKLKRARGASQSEKRKDLSNLVAKEAIRRGSADNVCVAIVWLK